MFKFVQEFKFATSTLWLDLPIYTTPQMKDVLTAICGIQSVKHCVKHVLFLGLLPKIMEMIVKLKVLMQQQ